MSKYISTTEVAHLLGLKEAVGRDALRSRKIPFEDGPRTKGGNLMILVKEEDIRDFMEREKAYREEVAKKREENGERNRFVPTVKMLETLLRVEEKIDALCSALGGVKQ